MITTLPITNWITTKTIPTFPQFKTYYAAQLPDAIKKEPILAIYCEIVDALVKIKANNWQTPTPSTGSQSPVTGSQA